MKPGAEEIGEFPEIGTLHEVFAQARAEPQTVTIFKGWTRLTTDDHGDMEGSPLQGFYAANTQFMSHYELTVNGQPVSHRLSVQLSPNEWSTTGAVLRSGEYGNLRAGRLPEGSIDIRVLRKIDGGWTERIFVCNNGVPPREVRIDVRFAVPIRDDQLKEEMKVDECLPWRGCAPKVSREDGELVFRYGRRLGRRECPPTAELARMYGANAPKAGDPVTRGLEIRVRVCAGEARLSAHPGRATRLVARARLGARQKLCLELRYSPTVNTVRLEAPDLTRVEPLPRIEATTPEGSLRVDSSNSTLNLVLGQAMADLRSLGLPVFGEKDGGDESRLAYNAGIPRYIGLFGRDNLVTAWQSPLFGIDRYESALVHLELLQGVRDEPWRDEERDRFPHERRLDTNSEIGRSNRELYYGDVTSTPFWILALSTLYQWTGDAEVLRRHRTTVERCCRWILRRLKQGGGFIVYAPARPGRRDSNRNQAWKDSGDAIVDGKGRICVPPLAVAEIQGLAYQALMEAAEIFRLLDGRRTGSGLRRAASALRERFNERFWLPEEQFYAVALGNGERPVGSVASNIGHCLSTGIVDERRIPAVVRRLVAPDLFSGWGVRTLSSDNAGYDPFSYHRGSVWPVENAIIASGMAGLGWREESLKIVTAQLGLAALFQHMRLPEVISGHARTPEAPTPGLYNYANLLQAWSVSAIAQHLQSILGFRPRADLGRLYLDPYLPKWLRWIELRNAWVGGERVDLRFWRDEDGRSRWEPLGSRGRLEIRSGPPELFAGGSASQQPLTGAAADLRAAS